MKLSTTAQALILALLLAGMAGPTKVAKKMSRSEIEALAREVGFPDPRYAATIALRESGGDPHAVNDNPPREVSYGLWQINTLVHKKYKPVELLDPRKNAEYAFEISQRGTNWTPWSTHRRGEPFDKVEQ